MLKVIKHLYKDNSLWIAIAIAVAIVFLSLGNVGKFMPKVSVSFFDKIQHAFAYLVLTLSWIFTIASKRNNKQFIAVVAGGTFLLGLTMEVLQKVLTDYRQFDLLDVLANSLGVVLAIFVYKFLVPTSFKDYLKTK